MQKLTSDSDCRETNILFGVKWLRSEWKVSLPTAETSSCRLPSVSCWRRAFDDQQKGQFYRWPAEPWCRPRPSWADKSNCRCSVLSCAGKADALCRCCWRGQRKTPNCVQPANGNCRYDWRQTRVGEENRWVILLPVVLIEKWAALNTNHWGRMSLRATEL